MSVRARSHAGAPAGAGAGIKARSAPLALDLSKLA